MERYSTASDRHTTSERHMPPDRHRPSDWPRPTSEWHTTGSDRQQQQQMHTTTAASERQQYSVTRAASDWQTTSDLSCPLCTEQMDYTDRHFNPCRCGYQVCLWCWHQIMEVAKTENIEGRCPACRSPYDKEKVMSTSIRSTEVDRIAATPTFASTTPLARPRVPNSKGKAPHKCRKDLSNVRVVQRNLACVMGLPLTVADEETLERRKFFGQYGRILKLSVSKATYKSTWPRPTASVFVTFRRVEDAAKCIEAVDGCVFEGETLRACFGTTKYCNSWLKNAPCNNPDCLFLHDLGFQEESGGGTPGVTGVAESESMKKWGSGVGRYGGREGKIVHGGVLVGLPPPLS